MCSTSFSKWSTAMPSNTTFGCYSPWWQLTKYKIWPGTSPRLSVNGFALSFLVPLPQVSHRQPRPYYPTLASTVSMTLLITYTWMPSFFFLFVSSDRTRQTIHQTRKETETKVFAKFWLPEKDPSSRTKPRAPRSHQPQSVFTNRSGSQHSLNPNI